MPPTADRAMEREITRSKDSLRLRYLSARNSDKDADLNLWRLHE